MAEIVNLNRFRKARQKAEESQDAAENRVRFGRNKAEKARDRQEAEKSRQDHAGKELDKDRADESEDPA